MKKLIMVNTNKGKVYCLTGDLFIEKDSFVIIDSPNGLSFAKTLSAIKEHDENDIPNNVANIVRIATKDDIFKNKSNINAAREALVKANEIKKDLKINMKILDASFSFDRSQLLFIFTADGRVDFRELAKKLAQIYRTRIELRQIGVRDNARRIGGIGPCGRFLCCSTFLTEFDSVSINMAKNQFIALNPAKINGVCGRLLCCLKYEDDQYSEMKREMPRIGQIIDVNGVSGKVSSVNLFLNTAIVETKSKVFVEVNLGDKNGSNK